MLLAETPAEVDRSCPVETARAGVPKVPDCGLDDICDEPGGLLFTSIPAPAATSAVALSLPLARLAAPMSAPQHSALQ